MMEKILKVLFRKDYLKHFFVGFFIFAFFGIFFSLWLALMFTAIIAVLKEIIYDGIMKKGTPEVLDVIYGIAPGLTMYLILML